MKKILAMILALVLAVSLLAGCGAQTQPTEPDDGEETQKEVVTLKLAITNSTSDPVTVYCQQMAERIKEKTDGGLNIEVYANGELGSLADTLEMVQQGSPLIWCAGPEFMYDYVPDFAAFLTPFIYESATDVELASSTPIFQELAGKLQSDYDLKCLSMAWAEGTRHILTTEKPVKTPEELVGMKMRVSGGKCLTAMFEAWGATPITVPWNETYQAMQTGVVDGCEAAMHNFDSASFFEVAKYVTLDAHTICATAYFMNNSIFESMPVEYQELLMEELDATGHEYNEFLLGDEARLVAEWQEKYPEIEFIEVDTKAFAEACSSMNEALFSPGIFDTIREQIEALY